MNTSSLKSNHAQRSYVSSSELDCGLHPVKLALRFMTMLTTELDAEGEAIIKHYFQRQSGWEAG